MNHRLLIIFSLLLFVLYIFSNHFKISAISLVGILAALLAGLNVFLSCGFVGFEYYIKWLIFLESILIYYIAISGAGYTTNHTINFVFWLSVIQCIIHFINSFNSQYYIAMWSGSFLQLIYGNKNSTAMHLLLLSCVFALSYTYYKKHDNRSRRIISAIMFFLLAWMIYKTGSRSSYIGLIFIVPSLLSEKIAKKILKPPFIVFCLVFPFLFAAIYVAMYKIGFEGHQLIGRSFFNGREQMWIPVFNGFPSGWIIGMFSQFAHTSLESNVADFQLHNSIIDLIASYGAIVTGLFLWSVYKILQKMSNTGKYINDIVILCILALVIQSTGEAAIMSGTRAIFVAQLFLFCDFEENNTLEYE